MVVSLTFPRSGASCLSPSLGLRSSRVAALRTARPARRTATITGSIKGYLKCFYSAEDARVGAGPPSPAPSQLLPSVCSQLVVFAVLVACSRCVFAWQHEPHSIPSRDALPARVYRLVAVHNAWAALRGWSVATACICSLWRVHATCTASRCVGEWSSLLRAYRAQWVEPLS